MLAGSRSGSGCWGAHYEDSCGKWDDVTVSGYYTLELKNFWALADTEDNKLILPSGVRCKLSDLHCKDTNEEYTFWESLGPDPCHINKYSMLYHGPAHRMTETEGMFNQTLYTITGDEVTFALVAKEPKYLCTAALLTTEHPKLFILLNPRDQGGLAFEAVTPVNMDMMTYVNSKFVYVEHHFRTQMKELYRDILIRRCELEVNILRSSLTIAVTNPDQFAYYLMKKPGYMAYVAGEVVHIIQCAPQKVTIRATAECYRQIPVFNEKNESYFLTPQSHILVQTGYQMECNRVLPIKYKIDDQWYDFIPEPNAAVAPTVMQPQIKATWRYINAGNLASSGIYSSADLKRLRDHVMFPAEQPAIVNTLARTVSGRTNVYQGLSAYHLFDDRSLKQLAAATWTRVWGSFINFGTVSAAVIGIILVFRVIKLVIDTIVHGIALHQVYGWSIHLLAAIWGSITHLLVSLAKEDKKPTEPEGTKPSVPILPHDDPTKVILAMPPQVPQAYFTFHKEPHDLSAV